MFIIILLFLGLILLILGISGYLSPWNNVSKKIGLIIILVSIVSLSANSIQIENAEPFNIDFYSPSTSGWGEISGSFNKEQKTISILFDSSKTNCRIPVEIYPDAPVISKNTDRYLINIEISNYSIDGGNYSLIHKTKRIFYANITDPDGEGSGDAYYKSYPLKPGANLFYLDFKFNEYTGDFTGARTITIDFYDNKNFHEQYKIKVIGV